MATDKMPAGLEACITSEFASRTASPYWNLWLPNDSTSTAAIGAANALTFSSFTSTFGGSVIQPARNWIGVMPIINGADGDNPQMVIKGWSAFPDGELMVGRVLVDAIVTASTSTFSYKGNTYRICDTISTTSGGDYTSTPPGVQVLGPGGDDPVELVFDVTGYQCLTIEFDESAGAEDGSNALWRDF